jgi:hypothetical protein
MKNILFPVIVIVSLMAILLTGCEGLGYTPGSGSIQTKQYDLNNFDIVEISNSFQFEIKQSAEYSVKASCRENIAPYLDIYTSGKALVIRLKPGVHTNGDLSAYITLPDISRLEISGASHGSARGFSSQNNLTVIISGASQLDMDIEAGETRIENSGASKLSGKLVAQQTRLNLSGAGHCDLKGSADDSSLDVSGASTLSLKDFQLRNVNINVSGASTATIRTDGMLNLDLSGASTLNYYGNPTLSKVNVTGASKLASKS